MKYVLMLVASMLPAICVASGALQVDLEVPEIDAEPYYRPYVAVWLESAQRTPIKTAALWYQVDKRRPSDSDGEKWLKDMRQWWRKLGRSKEPDIDHVTGATRKPGVYTFSVPTAGLPAGKYLLNFEAAREEGSRSYQRVEVTLPLVQEQRLAAKVELGEIRIYGVKQ